MSLTKATYSMIDGAPVNVLDYGATGDGTTDDTAAIQAAFDASRNVVFPPGTYIVNPDYFLPWVGTSKRGLQMQQATIVNGYGATLKWKAGTYTHDIYMLGVSYAIDFSDDATRYGGVTIKGLTIDGNVSNVSFSGDYS